MKKIVIIIAICLVGSINAQDSLTVEQLQPLTHTFDVKDGKLIGEGSSFLIKEMSKAQFTMIGEYHGSKRISEFTEAIIPILDAVGYKTMVIEVGPISGQILNHLEPNVKNELNKLNNKYLIKEDDGYVNLPIPFFESIEDAHFLEKVKSKKWNLIGIDQEFYHSYQMLIDRMYNNLTQEYKLLHKSLYQQTSDSITKYYEMDLGDKPLAVSIKKSKLLKDFTSKMSNTSKNTEIVEALYASNNIYWLYETKQWFENNSTRIKYMKSQLKKQLEHNQFDLSKDKLLIKMGGVHLSKGFSPLALYEVGNTLNEIAEYNENTALNIGFSTRYYMEDGKLLDVLESTNKYYQRTKDLDQMGKEGRWIVIDLRPMIKGHFYNPVKYKFNKHIEDLVKRYDLLIIPKTETDPTPNYD